MSIRTVPWWTELTEIFPDKARVVRTESVLDAHGRDFTYHEPHLPDAVVFVKSQDEVVTVMRFAHSHQIPVVPFGAGSSLEGHVIPVEGGISLDFTQMNRIVEFRPDDFLVRVEPGVTREQLNDYLRHQGLFFPVDPGANATIGGMTATNASGTNAVRYGAMRDQVKGLEVVLADGTVLHTGGLAVKSSAGYNLTGLFVGSEGTLGVFTEITLRLQAIPQEVVAARAVFPDLDTVGKAAAELTSSGLSLGRIELVDAGTVRVVNAYKGTHYDEAPTLFLEFSGDPSGVARDVEMAQELCEGAGCTAILFERDKSAREKLWEARHHASLAMMASAPGKKHMVTDVCVPISALPGALHHARQTIDAYGLDGMILGHVGDGNYHAGFMVDPADDEDMARFRAVNEAIVEYALARGGTCTGEHGVGLGKRKYLAREHGDEALAAMRGIKRLFDPQGILNPEKVVTEKRVDD
ncbi:FAD-binding protein [Alicyclobacillus fastidiosus]|uniref:D-lactate dehydrogenase (cytochrome) n=1 Tax=Alicyclobacillus fastidiosus TaxID=392011 RepID=A0ABY6ZDU8_9BACL|nr:FAD-linked oxidase C-terminal domain-containing protein [Alicyclobacillus fastidiosus]WAH41012.1 FAD-binding protein [Alicyclobacillus fastidiosus]